MALVRPHAAVPPPGPANYFDVTAKRDGWKILIILDYASRFPGPSLGRFTGVEGKGSD
jgi:hypothetical protein